MKKLIITILAAIFCAGICHGQNGSMLYTASYSSNFVAADASYSQKVLDLWKDFEKNTFTNDHLNNIADTVTMMRADGTVVKSKASNLAGVKQFRDAIKDMKVAVEAWISLKSVDQNKNFVLIWGMEDYTDPSGKHVSQFVHEIWGFNKDGKIDLMRQYSTPISM